MELQREKSGWILAVGVAVVFFGAVAPTLTWLEFSGGSENLNVATALEIRRTGSWVVPTLQGEPRVAKPPLTAWITANAISGKTMRMIDSGDVGVRERGYRRLGWEVRWPMVAMGCLTLMGVFVLGKMVGGTDGRHSRPYVGGGEAVGVASALVCATCYAFLRFERQSTTDVPLFLFVVWTNVFLAMALLQGKWWRGMVGGGFMLGMALMSKGPVAVIETVIPAVVMGFWMWRKGEFGERRKGLPSPLLVGGVVALAVGLWWYGLVAVVMQRRGFAIWAFWWSEFTGEGASDLKGNHWYQHLSFFPMSLPWLIFLIGGIWQAVIGGKRSEGKGLRLMLLMVAVPILVMSLSRDRKERFLLPLYGAGSVLAGYAVVVHARTRGNWTMPDKLGEMGHWGIMLAAAVVFPILACTPLIKAADGSPWLWVWQGVAIGVVCAALLVGGMVLYHGRRRDWALVWAGALAMLVAQVGFVRGYARSSGGLSAAWPLANQILAERPDGRLYAYLPDRSAPEDLSIYTNRIVRKVESPAKVTDGRGVLVTRWKNGIPNGKYGPEWREIGRQEGDGDLWLAYVKVRRD